MLYIALDSLITFQFIQVNAANPYGDSGYIFHSDSTSVLSDAKKEVQKEIETLTALKEQHTHVTNIASKTGDEAEGDDTETGQDSVSEDDSDDDSDRKGIFYVYTRTRTRICISHYIICVLIYIYICYYLLCYCYVYVTTF